MKLALSASRLGSAERFDALWATIIEPMIILWYPPAGADNPDDLDAWAAIAIQNYIQDLIEFDPPTLANGWTKIRRTHTGKAWPTIAAIRAACVDAQKSNAPATTPATRFTNQTRWDAMAADCLKHQFGQKSIKEGWGWDLFCYVRDRGFWPKGAEIDRLKDARNRAAIAIANVDTDNPMLPVLTGLWEGMAAKEEWVRRTYLAT